MWTQPVLLTLIVVVVLVAVVAVRPPTSRWRWAFVAAAIAATAAAWMLARREIEVASGLEQDKVRHCERTAQALRGVAISATVEASDPDMFEYAKDQIRQPVISWITSDVDFCMGWRKGETCEHALYAAMNESDPRAFVVTLEAIAAAVQARTACGE